MRRWREIKKWEAEDGWRINPGTGEKDCYVGLCAHLEDDVRMGKGVWLGDCVWLGNDVRLGEGVRMGDHTHVGGRAWLGDGAQLGFGVQVGSGVRLGVGVRLGNYVSIPVYKSYNYAIHWHSPGMIRAGCIIKPFGWCLSNVRQVAAAHGYPPDEQARYAFFIEQIIEWETAMGDKVGWVEGAEKCI